MLRCLLRASGSTARPSCKAVASIPRLPRPTIRLLTTSIPRHNALPSSGTVADESEAASESASSAVGTSSGSSNSSFVARSRFELPTTTPSWYAGHMARAIRSMPYLLARYPPPLVIEARDARLPLTSINPVFEKLLKKAPAANDGLDELSTPHSGADASTWRSRRLIVYLKRDLIDPQVEASILTSMRERDPHQHILFIDTRLDSDVKRVLHWVTNQARKIALDESVNTPPRALTEKQEKRAKKGLSGAFRHTPTPEEGVRLLILGMPNVGKSSLLNALRRVGTGKGKAASTAPHPGHTRKLTGTVRISKAGPSKVDDAAVGRGAGRVKTNAVRRHEEEEDQGLSESGAGSFMISSTDSSEESSSGGGDTPSILEKKPKDPPIYVYDTPGVMVPFLGHGAAGAERGIKLAITAGIKDSLFDVQLLADYLLFRLNLRTPTAPTSSWLPSYVRNLPLSLDDYLSTCDDAVGRTNSIQELLWHVAGKAPGSLRKGNVRDLDAAAQFMLQHWRLGKLDSNTELDLNTTDHDEIQKRIAEFFEGGQGGSEAKAGDARGSDTGIKMDRRERGAAGATAPERSKTQVRKHEKAQEVLARKKKLMSKGIAVGAKSKRSGGGGAGGKKRRK